MMRGGEGRGEVKIRGGEGRGDEGGIAPL